MQNKKNNSNSRHRSDFDGPSDVIINCKSSGKFMDFRNDLVAAYPKDYANIQGFGGAKHARNSGIRITLTEYGKGQSTFVGALVPPYVFDAMLEVCRRNIGTHHYPAEELNEKVVKAGFEAVKMNATVSSLISEGIKICRNCLMHTPETQHGILGDIGAALKRVREIGNRQQPSPNALGRYHSDFNYSQIRVNMHALDNTGCCKVNQVEIKRNQFQPNGAVSRLPWYVCVTEFRAKPKERGNGATNYDPRTVKEKRSVYINVSDMDMYNATWSVGRFVDLWYATVGQSVLIEGLRMKDAARNGGYSGQDQNYGNGQNSYDDYGDGFDCGDFNGDFNGGYGDFQR